ncbi:MAG: sporulation protein YunB, partial [Anaerotignaceae bacterium]
AVLVTLTAVQEKVMPSLLTISQIEVKRLASQSIDKAVKSSISAMDIRSSDFFSKAEDNTIISANTLLINELCSNVSTNINREISLFKEKRIEVALGALSGWDVLANSGPLIGFRLRQMGDATVDYETSFNAAGINQTNYKVWLNITLNTQLVNPLKTQTIAIQRKVMIIDTVIEGVVPQWYMGG